MPGTKASSKKKETSTTTDWSFVEQLLSLALVRMTYMWGPPGIGKTYSSLHTGRIENGVYAVTLTEDTPVAELRGHYLPVGNEMVWRDGPIITAMREGARLVLNEISHAPPEAMSFMYPVLESEETAQLTLPTNETVRPAEGFHVVVTDNLPPDELPGPVKDRFDCTIEIGEPHPAALDRLSPTLRRAALRCFDLEDERRVSIRGWLAVERLKDELGLLPACRAVFGPKRGQQIHDAIVLGEA